MTDLGEAFSELVRLETGLWNAADARLRADLDLTLGRYEVMRVIDQRSSCRVHDIVNELVITVGGTSKLIDRIETSGHCRRWANPEDGRSSIIELTPSGMRQPATASATLEDELTARIDAVLSPRALARFAATLTKLRAAARATERTVS